LVVAAETREADPVRRGVLEKAVRERAGDVLGTTPDEVILVAPRTIPKTSSGKLRRGSTRTLYLEGRLAWGSRSLTRQLLSVGVDSARVIVLRGVSRLPRYAYGAYAWGLVILAAPWVWIGVALLRNPKRRWSLVRGALRLVRVLAGIGVEIHGRDRLPAQDRRFVLAANHQSYLDAMVLIEAIPRPLTFVAKRELADRAWLRVFLERLGTVFVDRFDPRSGADDSRRFSEVIQRGEVLAFFPEGTFRVEPGLLRFRMGAFVAAMEQGLPILPVAISGTRDIMAGDSFLPRPGRCRVTIGDQVEPGGRDWKDAVDLRNSTRQFILDATGETDLEPRGKAGS
jgi:1-acyl-sn-glycerol-3-phosphate acyltransferase